MAYIGPEPNPGQNREVDDISSGFNGSEVNFTLQVNSQNVSPGSSNAIIVSVGGVIQNPGTDYTVAASTLTFTTAPASGLSFFGLVLGQQVDTEGTADGSITLSKFVNGTASNNGKFLRANNGAAPSFETVTGTTINNNADNRVITGSGTANTLNGESGLTFDGNTMNLTSGSGDARLTLIGTEGNDARLSLVCDDGDDHIDQYNIRSDATDNSLTFDQFESGSFAERMRINNGGNVGIGNTDPTQAKAVVQSASGTQLALIKDNTGASLSFGGVTQPRILVETGTSTSILRFYAAGGSSYGSANYTERLRMFNNTASVYIGRVDAEVTVSSSNDSFSEGVGVTLAGGGNQAYNIFAANNTTTMYVARRTTDGTLIAFYHNTGLEGNISVSGSTVSYNGGHLSRWSQLAGISETDKSSRPEIYQGTVMSNLDELCVWSHPDVLYTEQDKIAGSIPDGKDVGDIKEAAHTEDNQQLNKTKVSDTAGDKDVAGVFWAWDDDDDEYVNDFYIAMTGDMVIRVAASTTVARGDLLISAGDGTAKPQADDIVRSSTIAKIISTNHTATYPDGSKAYPCVLMAC